jgi:hypothetical protein
LNVDLLPLAHPGVNTLIADISDSGQMFNALSSHFDLKDYETGKGPAPIDAVVHFAAVPRVQIRTTRPSRSTRSAPTTSSRRR